jgi:malate synthase
VIAGQVNDKDEILEESAIKGIQELTHEVDYRKNAKARLKDATINLIDKYFSQN